MPRNHTLVSFIAWAMVPVVVLELCLSPFWFAKVYADHAWLPLAQLLLTGLLLPIYLAVLGVSVIQRSTRLPFIAVFSVVVASVLLAVFLDYTVWGVSTRMFWKPDPETKLLLTDVGAVALAISAIPLLFAWILRHFSRESQRPA